MLFNSFAFALFFPVVTLLYFTTPHAWRWLLLLVASCFFYMYYKPVYLLILVATITIDYIAGRAMADNENESARSMWLAASIGGNLGILFLFKYFNFFSATITEVLHQPAVPPLVKLALPIGLSFHTFQAMSYTIEVYKRRQPAEKHFGIFALYVLFYPQLVAGPIERPQHLLHQFREKHSFNYDVAVGGLQLMVRGIFKKVVVADRLALVTDRFYWDPAHYSPVTALVAVLFFSVQIYCDFSGYTDIATGSAQVMGFRLMKNFNAPYSATSIADFWRRWHISLSTWFRDYVYIPLGGNKLGWQRQLINILIVFVLSGLWHGASVTFIIWGAIHGLLYIGELALTRAGVIAARPSSAFWTATRTVTTFILVSLAWVFFRAGTPDKALAIFRQLALVPAQVLQHTKGWHLMAEHPVTCWQLAISFILMMLLFVAERLQPGKWVSGLSRSKRWAVYYTVLFIILIFGVFGNREFIYFQF